MPIIPSSDYQRPFYLVNGHMETILPSLLRKIEGIEYERERLELWDGDFLDLDWLIGDSKRLLIISHGLEGSSDRHYVKSMARYFFAGGWDVLAWNCRSCSGTMNRLPRLYHHGATDDLSAVIAHALARGHERLGLAGFSMGGSMTLKYLGENGDEVPEQILGGVAISVPCNLWSSAVVLKKPSNGFYKKRFLSKLKKKMKEKATLLPDQINAEGIDDIQDFDTFDERFTAPLHGFESARDFYDSATCDQYLPGVRRPALILNALNDPLLGEACYPFDLLRDHPNVWLETPRHGGHVGFMLSGWQQSLAEVRAHEFLSQQQGQD